MALDTLAKLRASLVSTTIEAMETDPIPAWIADHCARKVGKPLTKRDTDALEAAFPGLTARLRRKEYGGACIVWWVQTQYMENLEPGERAAREALAAAGVRDHNAWQSIQVSRRNVNAVWPAVVELRELNRWCYEGREARNAEREGVLAATPKESAMLREIAERIDAANLITSELAELISQLPENVGDRVFTHASALLAKLDDACETARKARE